MSEIRLEVEALNLWRGESWLVRDLSFTLQAGELVHVRGPNGSGKTTLLRALCGLTRPESGTIRWQDEPVGPDCDPFYRSLAWLGHADGLAPELTPAFNLRFARRLAASTDAEPVVALEDAGLAEKSQLPVRVLSAGQKRRAALARVFSSCAPLWILDEPFANLDAAGQQWGLDKVRRQVAGGGAVILTTHLSLPPEGLKVVELRAT